MPRIDILSPEDLEKNHQPEYPAYTLAQWREAVVAGHTIDGYWTWVHNSLCDEVAEADAEKYDEQCLGAKLLTPEEVSDRIKAEYLTSGCQASDVDWAVGELMAHCGELFETPEHAWSFLMEETHENLEKPE